MEVKMFISKRQLQDDISDLWELIDRLVEAYDQQSRDIDTLILAIDQLKKEKCECKVKKKAGRPKGSKNKAKAKKATVVCKDKKKLNEAIGKKKKAGYVLLTEKKNKDGKWVATFELVLKK